MDEKVVEKRQPTRERYARCCAFASAGEKKQQVRESRKGLKKTAQTRQCAGRAAKVSRGGRWSRDRRCGYGQKSRAMNEMFLQLLFRAFAGGSLNRAREGQDLANCNFAHACGPDHRAPG